MTPTPDSAAAQGIDTLFHADALPLGTMLAEFEVTGLLGVGGFGMVYDAFDHSLQRMVAIKEYMPSALAGRSQGATLSCRSSSDQDAFGAGLVSFIAEARLLAQFDHPSLVKVYRFWEANNTAYMVMPLYKGLTLKHARALASSPPPEAWLRHMLWSVLSGLEYLHAHKVVHRDISPDNIFLQEVGPPVLLDLGAARRAIGESSHKHTAILKVNYAPIEQYADASDMPQGPWTDLYALAAVVHGSLCNAQPLPATFRVVRDRMPSFSSVAKTVESIFGLEYSSRFVRAFSHALEIQPQDRPQSVQAFIDELGLTAPAVPQTMAWGGLPAVGKAPPPVDSDAKTELQAPHKAVTTIDAPSTDDAPLQLVSAYGVLEEESPLLAPHPLPAPAPADVKPLIDAAPASMARQSAVEADAAAPVRKAKDGKSRVAPPKSKTQAAARAPTRKIKPVPVLMATALVLLAGAAWWVSSSKPAAPQVVQPSLVTPVLVVPGAEASAANQPAQQGAAGLSPVVTPVATPTAAPASAVVPQAAASAPPGGAAAQKSKLPVRAADGKASPDRQTSLPKTSPTGTAANHEANASGGGQTQPPGAAPDPVSTPANPTATPTAASRAGAGNDRPGPREICADRNFLVRPMCLHVECEKPEFAQLAFCVENRQRLKEQARPNER